MLTYLKGYYDGATGLYEYGWGTSFHFSRYYKGESFYQALARHEHYLAFKMDLKPVMRVLDVGCGTGILSMFAAKAGAKHVVGVRPALSFLSSSCAQTSDGGRVE